MLTLPPLSLYIHIPWCVRKCPYCDFNSHEGDWRALMPHYIDALANDLKEDQAFIQGRKIDSIFFGGGTPSLFPASALATILENVMSVVTIKDNAEITLETNPGTAEYSNFDLLKQAGINRISFGAQSFDNRQLENLGRIHNANDIYTAINAAQDAGIENINIDIMHGLSGQGVTEALDDLEKALSFQTPHLSWYQLTIEPNTAFYNTPPTLPDDDSQNDIFQHGRERLLDAGFIHYETSAYARAGKLSHHNMNYWQFGDYLAIGAGAHGKISQLDSGRILRYQKTRAPKDYLNTQKRFTAKQYAISLEELPLEFMMNALRLNQGVPSALYEARTGQPLSSIQTKIQMLQQQGLLEKSQETLAPTAKGQLFLNNILAAFS